MPSAAQAWGHPDVTGMLRVRRSRHLLDNGIARASDLCSSGMVVTTGVDSRNIISSAIFQKLQHHDRTTDAGPEIGDLSEESTIRPRVDLS